MKGNVILLMEEILHHLGWLKPYKWWDNHHPWWCRILLPQQYSRLRLMESSVGAVSRWRRWNVTSKTLRMSKAARRSWRCQRKGEKYQPWMNVGVSKNNGTTKSSILIGFSIINHPFWGTTIFGNTHVKRTVCWIWGYYLRKELWIFIWGWYLVEIGLDVQNKCQWWTKSDTAYLRNPSV